MKDNKPQNIDEYKKWLKTSHNFTIDNKVESHYNSIANKILTDFSNSAIWKELLSNLLTFNNEYLSQTGYQLFNNHEPILVIKSFSSFLEKSFRKNIIFNKRWPNPPSKGWITPENWLETTNDILRTFFVVKYLDGVDFLMNKIIMTCANNNLACDNSFEAREEGYYALHLYTKYDFEIPKINWDTEMKSISIEIQITTQLQDVISKLTHEYYEQRRIKTEPTNKKWQWDYKSDEFTVNYLGHILHYLEGMIMEVRQKNAK